ncbi:MAG: hypothetical protein LKJ73_08230 [Oscillospiraceae bacterium]|jgi:hypothetical protein|nr:hypothetical protein [Oscillospiraceae bacterium]
MLGKLIKYEWKATQRIFLPLYGLIVLFTLINKAFFVFNFDKTSGMALVPFVITMIIYCVLIAATGIVTLVVSIQRFYKNLLGDEGYLSFTLPVKPHSHIDSKMIVTLIWTLLSIAVAALSIFILAVNSDTVRDFSEFCAAVGRFFSQYGFQAYGLLIELIVLMLVSVLSGTLEIYAAVTVGNLSGKHKLLAGFGAYIGFGVVEQIVFSALFNAGKGFDFTGGYGQLSFDKLPFAAFAAGFGVLILYSLVFGAAFYFFTNWMLSKKLNLE